MRPEELEAVCQEAARGLLEREGRPMPAAVVLPLPEATRVVTMPALPEDDAGRAHALSDFAADVMRPVNAPAFGFVAEAEQTDGVPLLVVVYGARGHAPSITAALLHEDGPGEWTPSEELHPDALPFLRALQAAVDAADPAKPVGGGALPGWPPASP